MISKKLYANCGTNAGFRKHVRSKTAPCVDCKEANKEYNRAWRLNNLDSVRESARNWARNNPESHDKWNRENPERRKEIKNNWRLRNPENARNAARKRRAQLRSLESVSYTEQEVLDKYGDICYLCETEIDLSATRKSGNDGWQNGLNIDHVVPISKGGPDTLENIRPVHALCNYKKGDRVWQR